MTARIGKRAEAVASPVMTKTGRRKSPSAPCGKSRHGSTGMRTGCPSACGFPPPRVRGSTCSGRRSANASRVRADLHLPPQAGRLRARLIDLGAVASERYDEHGWTLAIDAPRDLLTPLPADLLP